MVNSCIYEGTVRHSRLRGGRRDFAYPYRMLYVDHEEATRVLDGHWLWSTRRPAPVRFRRSDFVGGSVDSLARCVAERLDEPLAQVCTLAVPRQFGFGFNPISVHFAFRGSPQPIAALAEVTNTPWNERQTYALKQLHFDHDGLARAVSVKELHVSPFLPMNVTYEWEISAPTDRLRIAVSVSDPRGRLLETSLVMSRQEITSSALSRYVMKPPQALLSIARIYYQAGRLRWAGTPHYAHKPRGRA